MRVWCFCMVTQAAADLHTYLMCRYPFVDCCRWRRLFTYLFVMPVLFAPFALCAYNVHGLTQQDHVALLVSLQTVDFWWRPFHHCV
jgi:hypothetical protein